MLVGMPGKRLEMLNIRRFIVNIVVFASNVRSGHLGINELRINHLLDNRSQAGLDMSISQLGIRWRIGNRLLAEIVKVNDDGEHTHSLGKGASEIIVSKVVLLEEIFADKLGLESLLYQVGGHDEDRVIIIPASAAAQ